MNHPYNFNFRDRIRQQKEHFLVEHDKEILLMAVLEVTLWMGVSHVGIHRLDLFPLGRREMGLLSAYRLPDKRQLSLILIHLFLVQTQPERGGVQSEQRPLCFIFGFGFSLINQLRIILPATEIIGENLFLKSLGIVISMTLLLCQELVPRIL